MSLNEKYETEIRKLREDVEIKLNEILTKNRCKETRSDHLAFSYLLIYDLKNAVCGHMF